MKTANGVERHPEPHQMADRHADRREARRRRRAVMARGWRRVDMRRASRSRAAA